MKKLLFSMLTVVSLSSVDAQIYSNNFEAATDLQGWTLYNDSNIPYSSYISFLGNAWNIISLSSDPIASNKSLASTSWFTAVTRADRWAVTPSINLSNYSSATLQFAVRAVDDLPWNDGLIVKVSTSGTAKGSFTTTIYNTKDDESGEDKVWTTRTLDLTSFVGQTINIAFINQWIDGNILQVDNIVINGTSLSTNDLNKSQVAIYPNPVTTDFKLDLGINYNLKTLEVIVNDLTGKKVKSFKANELYNIADLAKGVYVLTVTDGTNKFTQKLIKK